MFALGSRRIDIRWRLVREPRGEWESEERAADIAVGEWSRQFG
jgi:hypothetical protein